MPSPELSPQQIINRMLAKARRVVADHEPRFGVCPVCQPRVCEARDVALAYLALHRWEPHQVLDGSLKSDVMLLTGLTAEEIDAVGGIDE